MDEQYGFRVLDAKEIDDMAEAARNAVDYGKFYEWDSGDILNLIATYRTLQAELQAERRRADKSAKIIVALQVIDPRLVDVVGRVVEQQRREELERMKLPEENPQMHNT